jgi:hypothetical protein
VARVSRGVTALIDLVVAKPAPSIFACTAVAVAGQAPEVTSTMDDVARPDDGWKLTEPITAAPACSGMRASPANTPHAARGTASAILRGLRFM